MTCNCCKNITADFAYTDPFNGEKLQFCAKCGHIQLKNPPSAEVISRYYEGEYSKNRASYLSPAYYAIMEKRAGAQLRYMAKHIELGPEDVFYDLGCGFGYLLKELSKISSKATGFEYDECAIEYCRKMSLNVKKIENENQISEVETGSVVSLSHTLEHLVRFDETLESLRTRIKYMFIEVPAYDAGMAEQFSDQEGHINFFTFSSLRFFLETRGFKLLSLDRAGPSIGLFNKSDFWNRNLRYLMQKISGDYFFNMYEKKNADGIWIRTIAMPG